MRIAITRQVSRFLNAQVATSSARPTILPSVCLSRALTRLFTRELDVFLAIVLPDLIFFPTHSKSWPFSEDFGFFFFFGLVSTTESPSSFASADGPGCCCA